MNGDYSLSMNDRLSKDPYEFCEPEKQEARNEVKRAIYKGWLKRFPCEVCGDAASEAHHEDYFLPLDIVWLCHKHHMARHAELRRHGVDLDYAWHDRHRVVVEE